MMDLLGIIAIIMTIGWTLAILWMIPSSYFCCKRHDEGKDVKEEH
jgi:hypothetical protein